MSQVARRAVEGGCAGTVTAGQAPRSPTHGQNCYGKTPMQTFIDSKSLALEKILDQQLEVKAQPSKTRELFSVS
ncbi:MAG: hypothetical protein F6K28_40050 [Microcoleus sp. SIO2G3]|nr:hypothetical protein [Microcoleus sp. SIO2G3]